MARRETSISEDGEDWDVQASLLESEESCETAWIQLEKIEEDKLLITLDMKATPRCV